MKKLVLLSIFTLIATLGQTADLNGLLKLSESRNLSIKISKTQIEQSYLNKKNAINDLIPNINFALSRSHKTFKDAYQKSNPFSFDTMFAYSIKLTQAYPGLGRIPWIKKKIAALQVGIKKTELAKSKISVIDEIVNLYFKLAKERELTKIDKKNIIMAQKLLEIANLNLQVGLILKNDVLRIEVEEYNYKSSLVTANKEFANIKTDIMRNLDYPDTASLSIDLPVSLRFTPVSLDKNKLIKIMLEKDEDISIAKTDVQILRKTIKMARSANLPTLSLESSLNHGLKLGRIKDTEDITTTFVLSTPIYDGGQIENSIRLAKKNKKIAELVLRNLINEKKAKLIKAIADYNEALERIKFSEKTVEQSFENMKIVFSRYKEGETSIVELIDAQTIVTRSAKTAINTYFDERKRLASIYLITRQREKLNKLAENPSPVALDFLFVALGMKTTDEK